MNMMRLQDQLSKFCKFIFLSVSCNDPHPCTLGKTTEYDSASELVFYILMQYIKWCIAKFIFIYSMCANIH